MKPLRDAGYTLLKLERLTPFRWPAMSDLDLWAT